MNETTASVTVNPLPPVSAGSDKSICAGDFTAVNATGAISYSWSNNLSNGVPFIPSSTSLYIVEGTDFNGCLNSDTVEIIVNNLPNVVAGQDMTICMGDTATLIGSGANVYEWSSAVINGVAFVPLVSNVYQVTGTDTNGCVSSDQVEITILPSPFVDAGPDATISCTVNSSGVQLGISGNNSLTYSWTPSVGINSNSLSNPFATPFQTTEYKLEVINPNNGCSSVDSVIITVDQDEPLSNAGPDATINCTENSSGVQLGISGNNSLTYSWTPSVGINSDSISNPFAIPSLTTEYVLEVINPVNGCFSTDTVIITVDQDPPSVYAGEDTVICNGSSLELNATTSIGVMNVLWSPTSNFSNPFILSPTAYPDNNTTYVFTAFGANGCENSDTVTISINELPIVDLGEDQTICLNDTIDLSVTSSSNTLIWSGMAIQELGDSISLDPTESGYVIATLLDSAGCLSSDSMFVSVLDPFVSNIIGDSVVCENEIWSKYSVNSGNTNIVWSVQNGTILGNSSPFEVLVHWGYGASGEISFEASDSQNNCSVKNQKTVFFQGLAPDTSIVQRIPNSNVLYTNVLSTYVQWGYTNLVTGLSANKCSNTQYCNFYNFDPTLYSYWVKSGDDLECLTKSYFNQPPYYLNTLEIETSYKIFPNPTKDFLNIQLFDYKETKPFVIRSAIGETVFSGVVNSSEFILDISHLSAGIYFVYLSNQPKAYKIIKE